MPECLYHRVEVRMDEKEEKLYRQKEKDMLLPFEDGDVDAVNAAALMMQSQVQYWKKV